MEVGGQLHEPAALPPGKEPLKRYHRGGDLSLAGFVKCLVMKCDIGANIN
jgi:hypothetical protein